MSEIKQFPIDHNLSQLEAGKWQLELNTNLLKATVLIECTK